MELAFAGLHQLCAPLLGGLKALAEPQRRGLSIAFGLEAARGTALTGSWSPWRRSA